MVNAISIGRKLVADDHIFQGEIYNGESEIIAKFTQKEIYECEKCNEQYDDEELAEECCNEVNDE